ncbi:MAG: type II secretion system protein M [Burkholderiaceae bacterium]|jgi:general secretion pathway protein M|nr:type II secretion system protein M [Burkholderiaceae bacterium]
MKPLRRPEHLWLLAGAVVLLALLAWAAVVVVSVHRAAAGNIEQIAPRYARVAGLLQDNQRLVQVDQAIKTNLSQYVYPAANEAGQAGNQALQRVRDLASARGLRVTSSQVAAPREEKGFDRIGLSLRVEGNWAQMQSLLAELPRLRPAIYSQTIAMGAQGGGVPGRKLEVGTQFELYVLKERQP